MEFELEPRDRTLIFPCSLCKKNNQPGQLCHTLCKLYNATYLQEITFINDVQKFINEYKKHEFDQIYYNLLHNNKIKPLHKLILAYMLIFCDKDLSKQIPGKDIITDLQIKQTAFNRVINECLNAGYIKRCLEDDVKGKAAFNGNYIINTNNIQ